LAFGWIFTISFLIQHGSAPPQTATLSGTTIWILSFGFPSYPFLAAARTNFSVGLRKRDYMYRFCNLCFFCKTIWNLFRAADVGINNCTLFQNCGRRKRNTMKLEGENMAGLIFISGMAGHYHSILVHLPDIFGRIGWPLAAIIVASFSEMEMPQQRDIGALNFVFSTRAHGRYSPCHARRLT
jgi:hypothetical protein